MWFFRPPPPLAPPTPEPELSDVLRKRLEERLDRFERIVKDLRLEWDEMYDKFRLLYARVSKRIKDAAHENGDGPQSHQDAPGPSIPRAVAYDRPFVPPGGPNPSKRNY